MPENMGYIIILGFSTIVATIWAAKNRLLAKQWESLFLRANAELKSVENGRVLRDLDNVIVQRGKLYIQLMRNNLCPANSAGDGWCSKDIKRCNYAPGNCWQKWLNDQRCPDDK